MNTHITFLHCACPDEATALHLGRWLVEQRLAACVNVLSGMTSLYRWKGEVQESQESLLVAKTTVSCQPRILDELPKRHPYDLPEIVFFKADFANPAFAQWISANTLVL
jgi:periplasmic divalent cation tolerance protein